MTYRWIKENQEHWPVAVMCQVLGVSRSGYHAWKTRVPSARTHANAWLLTLINQAHQDSRPTYGSPQVHHWLQLHGRRCGRQRVVRLTRGQGLRSQTKRRFRVALTDSNHDLPIAPNRLRQLPPSARRDAVWVADITYVETDEGWLYVAGVLNRHARRWVDWAMDDTLAPRLPLAALDMALLHRKPQGGLVHHSDRGVQYASEACR